MTIIAKESGRLAWLMATLGEQRNTLAALLRRLTCFGPAGSVKPAMFRKFLGTLEQVALEQEREFEILSRIQAIEARHRFDRVHRKLKCVSNTCESDKIKPQDIMPQPERVSANNDWLLIVGLICLMSRREPKPQE